MRDSIFYSAIRSLFSAFCAIIGIGLGFIVLSALLGLFSSSTSDGKIETVNTEEILTNGDWKRESLMGKYPVILQINVDGIIGTETLNMQTIKQQLVESRESTFKEDRVKALLLYLNTPGGTVVDADGIYRAIKEYKEKFGVPVYAYVDGMCASGGMYIAAAADKIYASEVSLVGSVGVLAPTFMNFSKTLDKLGIDTLTITAGKDKDAMNPLRPWKEGEEKNYRQIIDYYYKHFVDIVTAARPNLSKENLVEEYGAHVFPAPLSKEYGYIDVSGASRSDVIKELVKVLDIQDDRYEVIQLSNKGWWSSLFNNKLSLFSGVLKHQIQVCPEMDIALQNKYLYLYQPQ